MRAMILATVRLHQPILVLALLIAGSTASAQANRATLTSHRTRRVALVPGSCIVLAGEAEADEPLRLDAIDLLPEPGGACVAADRPGDLLRVPVPATERGC